MAEDMEALIQRAESLIKSYNPSVSTVDAHVRDVLGEVKEVRGARVCGRARCVCRCGWVPWAEVDTTMAFAAMPRLPRGLWIVRAPSSSACTDTHAHTPRCHRATMTTCSYSSASTGAYATRRS